MTAGWCRCRCWHRAGTATWSWLLSVFDQALQVPGNRKLLEVGERQVPERYVPVLRRLEGAAASVEVADSMVLEDEVLETWGRMKREIAAKDATLTRERAEHDAALARERAEREAALAEKDAALARERARSARRRWQRRMRPWRGNGQSARRPRSARLRWRGGWRILVASRAVHRDTVRIPPRFEAESKG